MKEGINYKVFDSCAFDGIKEYIFEVKNKGIKKESKLFLKELLGLTSMEVSINIFKPKEEMPFFHKHKENEELFIVIKGEAEFIIDDETILVKDGGFIKIASNGKRWYKNISDTDDLIFIVIQGKENTMLINNIEDGMLVS